MQNYVQKRCAGLLSRLFLLSCILSPFGFSAANAEENTGAAPIAAPFASGQTGDLSWDLRVNRASCAHSPHPTTWCQASDLARVTKESGIEATLESWVKDPSTQSVLISYMTFTSSHLADVLCREARSRALSIDIFLQKDYVEPAENASGAYRQLLACSKEAPSLQVRGRGGSNWLHHAKIFLVSSSAQALPQDKEREARAEASTVRWTSSSANLSKQGLSLHYDNWLVFEAPAHNAVAQSNLCYFDALREMREGEGSSDRGRFIRRYGACIKLITHPESEPIKFLGVPSGPDGPQVLPVLENLISKAQKEIHIAAHRITYTGSPNFPLVDTLLERLKAGAQVSIVFDDDTILKYLRRPGSKALTVSREELAAYERLRDAGAAIRFIDTNESVGALMHHKFMLVDQATVWTGAGNFSAASLLGRNTEQFYLIDEPALADAYRKVWDELWGWALPSEHFAQAPRRSF